MATFLAAYNTFQIEVIKGYNFSSWREDVKICLMKCGVEEKPTTFLFVDTQIILESQLEDINSILNSADVTNLYKPEDLDAIYTKYKSICLKQKMAPTTMNMF